MAEIAPFGMQDLHESRSSETHGSGADYVPDPEEKKAIKLTQHLFERAKKHRAQYDEKWLDYYRMFRGKQWKDARPSYKHSEVINLIFRTIQSLVPIQVDARPKFQFLPQEPGDTEFAGILNELSESDWARKNWANELLEIVYDSNIYGTGLSRMVAREILGKLEICFESQDVFHSFPDPNAKDCNKDCGYFVDAEPTDVRIIKSRYPDKKDFIKADVEDMLRGSKTDVSPMKFRSPVDNRVTVESSGHTASVDKDKALLVTAWIRPDYPELLDDFEEHEKNDPETGEIGFEQRAKWPNGRKIVVCNGVLLEDSPLGYDDNEIPFQRYPNYVLPREFWGMSEVEQLEGPQKTFNKLVSFTLDVLTLMGNPIWINPQDSGVDSENIVNRSGLIIEPATKEQAPERVEGVQLQPYVLQMIDRMGEWFDSIGGSQDVSRGVQPTGVTAATAISTLQEAAQTRVRQKARNLDCFLQDVGRQWLSRTLQFTTAPKVYRLTNNEGASRYFKMRVEPYNKIDPETQQPTGEQGKRAIIHSYGENGQLDPENGINTYDLAGNFDVRVSTGSSLPFAKDEKERKLLAYFDRGIIDAEEVLKSSEYPNWESILQRVEAKAAMAAQQQAAAGAAPPPAA